MSSMKLPVVCAQFSAVLAALLLLFSDARPKEQIPAHDKAYWQTLRANGFKVPQGKPVLPLALEAASLLGSTDPELRDAVAYEALATWIYQDRRLDEKQLDQLRMVMMANARGGLGEEQGDLLFLRSFSILGLSVLAAADLKQPFLEAQHYDALVTLGVEELGAERDLRGYVPGKGWGHATAHCADLLKFLSRNHRLRPKQQAAIVEAIASRLRSAGKVFVWGEDARLAAALTSLASRSDADAGPFNAWFERLREEHAAVWSGSFEPPRYVAVRAQLNALAEFSANLEPSTGATESIRSAVRSLRAAAQ